MAQRRRGYGYWLAVIGSVGLIASLWRPWYSFEIPKAVLNEATQNAWQFGVLGPLIRRGADLLSSLGPLHVTAWQVYTFTPGVLLCVGVIAGGLSLLTLTGRAAGGSRFVAGAGPVGIVFIVYRFVARPGQGDLLHPAWGMYLGLIAAACILAGGLIAMAGEREEHRAPLTWQRADQAAAVAAGSATHSVPPPIS
jgi:hypothetical protein